MNVINAYMNGYHHFVKMKSIHLYMTYINHGWMDISIKRDAKKMNAHEHENFMENDTKNPSYRKKKKIIFFPTM
jgi:hypothetical protein